MWKSIKGQVRLELCDLGIYFAVEIGLCVLGMAIMICIQVFGHEKSYFPMGSMIATLGVLCMVLFGNIFGMCMGFDVAVSMGKTRRYYVPSAVITYFMMNLLLVAGLFVLLRVETGVYAVLLPGKIKESIPVLTKFTLPWVVGLSAVLTGCGVLGAAVVRQFKRGRIIILAAWLLGCWTIPGATEGRDRNILDRMGNAWGQWFAGFQLPVQISMLVGAGVIFTVIAYLLFRKQAVQW